jgi:hypothetical protein
VDRQSFGLLLSERRVVPEIGRRQIVADWVLPHWPTCEIFGEWSDEGQAFLGREIRPVTHDQMIATLRRWKCTLAPPASGGGWVTAKPWECFAAGVVCFMHPAYDDQEHVLHHAPAILRRYLRVRSPEELWSRVDRLVKDETDWKYIVDLQRAHFENRYRDSHGGVRAIEGAVQHRLDVLPTRVEQPLVGFAEFGRVMKHGKVMPNPYEALKTLDRLARLHPEWKLKVISPTSGDRGDLPDNVRWPGWSGLDYDGRLTYARRLIESCDVVVVFVNQHMPVSLNGVVPKLARGDGWVTTLQQARTNGAPTVAALNHWTDCDDPSLRDPVYVVNDPRSTLNARDLKWPPRNPIVAQYDDGRAVKHYRYGDDRSPEDLGYDPMLTTWSDDKKHWVAVHEYRATDYELISVRDEICPDLEEANA